jgi:hypothetical protein
MPTRQEIMCAFLALERQKPGFPLQFLGFAHANPAGFPLQSLAPRGLTFGLNLLTAANQSPADTFRH